MTWGFWLEEGTIYGEGDCRRGSKFDGAGRALVQFFLGGQFIFPSVLFLVEFLSFSRFTFKSSP